MAEAIVKKEPIQYNLKYNPSGFITETGSKMVKDPFGKQMKLRTVDIHEKLVREEPVKAPESSSGPVKPTTRQIQVIRPGQKLATATEQ